MTVTVISCVRPSTECSRCGLQMEDALSSYHALLKDDTATDDAVREHTRQIMECTAKFIAEAENEIKRQTNEKENTDS